MNARLILILSLLGSVLPCGCLATDAAEYVDHLIAQSDALGSDSQVDLLEKLAGALILIDTDNPVAEKIRLKLEQIPDKKKTARICAAIASDKLRQGDYRNACKLYFDLILRFPKDPNINRFRIAMARAYVMNREFDQAKAHLDPITRLPTIDAGWASLELAKISMLGQNLDEARRRYKSIEIAFPGSFAAKISIRELLHIQLRDQIKKSGV